MKPASKGKKKRPASRLTRDDWLDAAFDAVVEGGFDKVRVLGLADKLKVTRGSFYWHFADHAALVAGLLARWRARESILAQGLEAEPAEDARTDLEHVLDTALAHAGADLENMCFELALRAFSRRDAHVAKILIEVDQQRMRVFERKFRRLTGDPGTASELAALFYLAIVGSNQALSRPLGPPQMKQYLKGIITRYLIDQQTPAARKVPGAPPRPA